ncbi:MAG TPA: T9SS type A sorting domain-containing protein, partial [Alphaproteobacteria bacterium]|nr:T9SS type A sorting domain-containing protein [Alphaproteobacteria bacterium]
PDSYTSIPSQSFWPFNSNQWYLMINLAISQSGPNANTVLPNQMEIDYVRVYQENLTSTNVVSKDNAMVFPNPASNYFSVNSQEFNHLKLYNLEGKLLLERDDLSDKIINVSDLYYGVYLLELENKVGLKRYEKIIIQ